MRCGSVTCLSILITLAAIKAFVKIITAWDRSATCLVGKTCLVTGANAGIGYYIARDFAKRGAKVILACRNVEEGEKAKLKISKATGNSSLTVKHMNLASLKSVRDCAKDINETEERLDILVNNAGIAGVDDVVTCDGLNMIMQVNHLSPFLFTNLLIDLLKRSAPSRIVIVTCNIAYIAEVDPSNLNGYPSDARLPRTINYANSKLCNILFANELARKLKGTQVTVNSINPGFSNTGIYREMNPFWKPFVYLAGMLLFKTPEEGAQTAIYAATSSDVENSSGLYLDNCRQAWFPPMPRLAANVCLAKRVWEKSEELVQMTISERPFCVCKGTGRTSRKSKRKINPFASFSTCCQ